MGEEEVQPPPVTLAGLWQEYRVPIILGSASLLLIAVSLTLLLKSFQAPPPIEFASDASPAANLNQTITIDIEGALVKPGIYQLPVGSRVEEAIAAAGGLSAEADGEAIARQLNRAAKLSDGAKLYFPKRGEADGVAASVSRVSSVTSISINSASQSELESLPGIGPVTAKKIIDARPYQILEELVSKKALSKSLFEKLRDQLSL